jgi:hypothetical protein
MITVYYPLCSCRNNKCSYNTIAYDLTGTYSAFSDIRDFFKFFVKCFFSKKRCDKFCEKLNKEYG